MNHEDRVREARARIREITPADALRKHGEQSEAVWLDVREQSEWNLFRIPGAVHIPLGSLAERLADAVPRDREVIVYCGAGSRSALAADEMQNMGYRNVSSLAGGIRGWASAGGDLED